MRTRILLWPMLAAQKHTAMCAACVVASMSTAWGQTSLAPARESSSAEQAADSEAAKQDHNRNGGAVDQDPLADFRPALLREGSRLVEAKGRIRRDPSSGWWILKVDTDSPTAAAPSFEMILLPGTLLSEMQHVVESTPGQQVMFEVTGEVFVYRGRNFVMPTLAPMLITSRSVSAGSSTSPGAASKPAQSRPAPGALTEAESAAVNDGAASRPATSMPDPIKRGDSAQDIMRNLEQSIGPAPGNAMVRPSAADSADRAGEPRPGATPTIGVPAESAAAGLRSDRVFQEGTSVISRRGKLTRDPSGGWMFIFDADATGLMDPPMRLLPCMLLEELETFARHNGSGAAILISGQVYVYGGRNFLLPTVFRVPRERTNITP